jgi:type IV secretion system protein TrbL
VGAEAGGPERGAGGALGSAGAARPYTRAFGAAAGGGSSSAPVGGATRLAVGTDALADTGRAVPEAGASCGVRGCGTAESATAGGAEAANGLAASARRGGSSPLVSGEVAAARGAKPVPPCTAPPRIGAKLGGTLPCGCEPMLG